MFFGQIFVKNVLGSFLYFPFLTKNHAMEHDEVTQQIFAESNLPPTRTSIY